MRRMYYRPLPPIEQPRLNIEPRYGWFFCQPSCRAPSYKSYYGTQNSILKEPDAEFMIENKHTLDTNTPQSPKSSSFIPFAHPLHSLPLLS